ncbi:MAG TPA: DUF362 domain-containing protein [Methanothermococcus okinawensis]|uniref:DUF362 domain-containing protein n=1 Tax=Methanothermococcus okinawensis TaxID=155863 RepID=A0A833E5D1_9EURY|nr:DUF362 domain-containing protein [Methanococcaceae archaeon]HIP84108.1 DUF362 domain-containing protein [Methanothermococcus okinawensis]HIP91654.1 DUF362 domain-containing protein [Methanothermococcus okinawensis]
MEVYYTTVKNYNLLDRRNKLLDLTFSNLGDNKRILVKPNILGPYPPDKHVTTHPAFLDWILKYLIEVKGIEEGNIVVGESSGFSTEKAYEVSRIKEVCEKYGISFLPFERDKSVKIKLLNTTLAIPKTVIDSDLIINLPKLKTHVLMRYTGAVKNLYGCIPGGLKIKLHKYFPRAYDFAHLLVELYRYLSKGREIISVMDGIWGMDGNGPSNGKPVNAQIVIASRDALALDIFATYYIGYNPMDVLTNRILTERIENWEDKLNIFEVDGIVRRRDLMEVPRMNFRKPDTYYLTSILPPFIIRLISSIIIEKPRIDRVRCKRCGVCEKICPVGAISLENLEIDRKKCINCYCCHEMCRFNAIKLRRFL